MPLIFKNLNIKHSLYILLLFFSLNLAAQPAIQGKVINQTNSTAIPGASVFINNTSIGTVSNADGSFEISAIPGGKYELVISCIGFQTKVISISSSDLPMQLNIEMLVKVKVLDDVFIENSVEEGWDKWGKLFTEHFIGTSENAATCTIHNSNSIKFRYYKKSNRVIAYADEPLDIENKALGYWLRYQLENFEINYKERTTFYLGFALFIDKTKDGKPVKERWKERRNEAYNGSVIHFMKAFYNNRFLEEGFEVKRMVRTPNEEKQRVRALMKVKVANAPARDGRIIIGDIKLNGKANADSNAYYQSVLRQPDYSDIYDSHLITADSILVDEDEKIKNFYFENYLQVTYKNELEDPGFLTAYNENRKPYFQRSLVYIPRPETITVEKQGNYFDPQNFIISAYWGWSEKISNMLPIDFVPL